MIDAALTLIRSGTIPSSTEIAESAGVTQRTLFNQFRDMETLVMEVARRQMERTVELAPDVDPTLPLPERVAAYAAALELFLEETMHVRWALITANRPTQLMIDAVAVGRDYTRYLLAKTFAAELADIDDEHRTRLLDELEMVVDPVVWRLRRTVQGLSPEQARDRVADTLLGLLHPLR